MVGVKVLKGSWTPCGIVFGWAKASFSPLTYKRTLEPQDESEEEEELVHAHQVSSKCCRERVEREGDDERGVSINSSFFQPGKVMDAL